MPDSPADELRQASSLMRERAKAATPGRWRYNPDKHFREDGTCRFSEAVFTGPPGKEAIAVAITGETDDPQSMADAEHIAGMQPAVALAVADWLETEASDYDDLDVSTQHFLAGDTGGDPAPEIAVARAYLGTESKEQADAPH